VEAREDAVLESITLSHHGWIRTYPETVALVVFYSTEPPVFYVQRSVGRPLHACMRRGRGYRGAWLGMHACLLALRVCHYNVYSLLPLA
jgi:hypothetical protein